MEVWRSVQISIRKKSCEKNSTNFLSSWCFLLPLVTGSISQWMHERSDIAKDQKQMMCILSSIHVPCSVFEIFVRPICYQKPLDFRLCHFPLDFCVCCCLLKFIVMLLGNPVECTSSVNMPYYGVYFVYRSLFRGASFSIRFSFSHLIKGSPFSICREQLFCVPFFPFLFRCCCCIFFFCCSKT